MSILLRYRLLNVFTRDARALSGNPLCVFEDGSGLDTGTMQALARQFNLSETTFLLPSERGAHARVRIFTPNYEMPFAGHPTLGSAQVCRALRLGGDQLRLEVPAGIIPVHAQGAHWTLEAQPASIREPELPRARLAELLGLSAEDLIDRPLWVKAGKEQLVVPLTSIDAVRRVSPVPQRLQSIRSEDGQSMAYVFFISDDNSALARFFFPQGGAILEDPATGSATANFGAWCLAMKRTLPVQMQISQGEFVARPSDLYLDVTREREIFVGGDVVEIGRGSITL